MKKRFIILFAIMFFTLLVVGLTSCKKNNNSTENPSNQSPSVQEPSNSNNNNDNNDDTNEEQKKETMELLFTEIKENNTTVGYEVNGLKNTTLKEVVIPKKYNNLPVLSIGNAAFLYCSNLESVTIPDSVTSIGGWAFGACLNLINITIPDSVTSIGSEAFAECPQLQFNEYENGLYLGNTKNPTLVLVITKDTNITEINISNTTKFICDNAFSGCDNLQYNEYENGLYLGNTENPTLVLVKAKNTDITEINISEKTKVIYDNAFSDCSSLISVTMGDSVKDIGKYAFYGCSNLTNIVIPNGVTSIGYEAFENCSSLTSITIPNSVIWIGYEAFENCSSLTSVTIPNSVTSIGDGAFYKCSSLTSITIPNSVTSIGYDTFDGCDNLQYNEYENGLYLGNTENPTLVLVKAKNTDITEISISEKTKVIYDSAFKNCSSLISITIPDSVMSIGGGAFWGCSSLTSITIPNSVTSIGGSAFWGCSSLTSVTIPDSVTSIGGSAFYNCSKLDKIYYNGTIEDWCKISFGDNSNPMEYANHFYLKKDNDWEEVTSIEIPNSIEEIGYSQFYGFNNVTSITIPNGVTSIGYDTFYNCSSLTSIIIPNSVTSIGDGAFRNCPIEYANIPAMAISYISKSNLKEVVINSGTSLKLDAFYDCDNLESLTISKNVESIELEYTYSSPLPKIEIYYDGTIEDWCKISFSNSNLMNYANHFYLKKDGNWEEVVTSIEIPDGVTSIGKYAFYNCSSLTSITIPNSVTSIGSGAFLGCDNLQYNEYENGLYLGNTENPTLALIKAKNTDITEINISEKTKVIYDHAFSDCSSLISITIPDSVTSIGNRAFLNCSSLTSITIPDSVTSIGDYAFFNCSSLTSITIPDSVTSIGEYAFSVCANLQYNEYENGLYLGNEENPTLVLAQVKSRNITEITISNTTQLICTGAFEYCSSLTSITIPDSVTWIGSEAFAVCQSLTSITIPNGVKSIGEYAFSGCSSLTSVTIGDNVTSIGDYAFSGCSSLTSIMIPNSVTSIGYGAFSGSSSYPLSYQLIIFYKGTQKEWDSIEVDDSYNNTQLASATCFYRDIRPNDSLYRYWHYDINGNPVEW